MYTQEIVAQEAELKIQLPPELVGKELRVTIEEKLVEKSDDDREKRLQKAREFFRSIAVDMSNFKFDRDEANAR